MPRKPQHNCAMNIQHFYPRSVFFRPPVVRSSCAIFKNNFNYSTPAAVWPTYAHANNFQLENVCFRVRRESVEKWNSKNAMHARDRNEIEKKQARISEEAWNNWNRLTRAIFGVGFALARFHIEFEHIEKPKVCATAHWTRCSYFRFSNSTISLVDCEKFGLCFSWCFFLHLFFLVVERIVLVLLFHVFFSLVSPLN